MPDIRTPHGLLSPYDPWLDVSRRYPEVRVVREPMAGRLLGELRYPVIALRESSTAAQQRCTLAHELVHLDRGVLGCGAPGLWTVREERAVHAEAARRLLPLPCLRAAARATGSGVLDLAVAAELDVDLETFRVRMLAPDVAGDATLSRFVHSPEMSD